MRRKRKKHLDAQSASVQAVENITAYAISQCGKAGLPGEADDLVQNLHVVALMQGVKFFNNPLDVKDDEIRRLSGYLTVVVRNSLFGIYRSTGRKRTAITTCAQHQQSRQESEGDKSADQEEACRVIECASDKWMDITRMRFKEGMDYNQISKAIGLPIGTIKTFWHREARRIQRELQHT